jgi:hypothetical protein
MFWHFPTSMSKQVVVFFDGSCSSRTARVWGFTTGYKVHHPGCEILQTGWKFFTRALTCRCNFFSDNKTKCKNETWFKYRYLINLYRACIYACKTIKLAIKNYYDSSTVNTNYWLQSVGRQIVGGQIAGSWIVNRRIVGRWLAGRRIVGRRIVGRWNIGRWVVGRWIVGRWIGGRRIVGRWNIGRWIVGRQIVGRWNIGRWLVGRWIVGRRLVGRKIVGRWLVGRRIVGWRIVVAP